MTFQYKWRNKEANFGSPLSKQVKGGTHITFEIILKKENKYIALRRQSIPGHESPPHIKKYPEGLLFFCHDLIRYGESVEDCVKRIVKHQTGIVAKNFRVVGIESDVQKKDNQWAFTPYVIAELEKLPKIGNHGNKINEVVTFTKDSIPNDFAWWTKKELKDFLEEDKD